MHTELEVSVKMTIELNREDIDGLIGDFDKLAAAGVELIPHHPELRKLHLRLLRARRHYAQP